VAHRGPATIKAIPTKVIVEKKRERPTLIGPSLNDSSLVELNATMAESAVTTAPKGIKS